MDKVYLNQSWLKLTLSCGIDLTTAIECKIKYLKPDKTEGFLTAQKIGTEEIFYQFTKTIEGSELDQTGKWTFWPHIKGADERIAIGQPCYLIVLPEGTE